MWELEERGGKRSDARRGGGEEDATSNQVLGENVGGDGGGGDDADDDVPFPSPVAVSTEDDMARDVDDGAKWRGAGATTEARGTKATME